MRDRKKNKIIRAKIELDRERLNKEFSAKVNIIRSVPVSKNTESVEIKVNLPDGFDFDVWVVDKVEGGKLGIKFEPCVGDTRRITCTVYKGRDLIFYIKGETRYYDSRVIKISLVT
ncbi:MAG: hypothetical protein KAI67_04570 [Candidatus Pacebacteria bacterium]|nr:hypothetical protein [Candidatus Paceibacterota bacterium]